jgi:membrane protein required for colicin V production
MEIAAVDIGIVVVVAISGLISLVRGFVKETMSLIIWLSAFIVASTFDDTVSVFLVNLVEMASLRHLAAWGGLFVGTLLVGALANFLLGKLVDSTGLGGTDRTLGFVFGIFRGLLIVLAIVIILPKAIPVEQDMWWQESTLIPLFENFESWGRQAVADIKELLISWI